LFSWHSKYSAISYCQKIHFYILLFVDFAHWDISNFSQISQIESKQSNEIHSLVLKMKTLLVSERIDNN